MRPFVIGTTDDIDGFALAGVDGLVCATPDEARKAISGTDEETLILLSAVFATVPHGHALTIVLPPRP